MATSSLRLQFEDDNDGTGNLVVRAEANGFAGESSAYFGRNRLEAFAAELAAFPLVGRPSIVGGFWSEEPPERVKQEHVAIECYAVGHRGELALRVRLATPLWPSSRAESQHLVALEIKTTYEALRHFSRTLLMLVRGDATEALLESAPGESV